MIKRLETTSLWWGRHENISLFSIKELNDDLTELEIPIRISFEEDSHGYQLTFTKLYDPLGK